ncbi:MAG: CoA transferase [Deltaproteobacteria bacterium]|nr:CoA transferase [Deltaproteobacteria bacterium]
MTGALAGIKVLELASYITGPFASMLLADLGAEVIKIEMPGQGDPFRGWGEVGYSPTFCSINRNKRSVSLNIQDPRGKEIFLRLAKEGDVIIENMRPGVVDRLGVGYEAVRAVNPRVVYCSISGFGQDGPYKDRPGYDTIGQALGGLLSVLTDLKAPRGMGSSLSDHLTGLFTCYAVLGGLLCRERTGEGQKVETSLLQATVAFGCENGARYFATGEVPRQESRLHLAQVYAFVAGDGRPFVIHLSSPQKFWHGLADAIGRPELKEDPRFADREARVKNYEALKQILEEIFRTDSRQHWLEILEKQDVPAAPIKTFDEVFQDPQVRHLGLEVELRHPRMGPVRLVGSGVRMSRTPPRMDLPPPVLGEQTEEILSGLGYGREAISELRGEGVI